LIDIPKMQAEAKVIFTHFNAAEFSKSVKTYQSSQRGWLTIAANINWASDIIQENEIMTAFAERLNSYLQAEKGLVDTQLGKKQYVYCRNQDDVKHWYQLETLLKLKFCQQASLGKDFNNIVFAQHSISNMISTLNSNQYAGFSHQAINALVSEHRTMVVA